MIPHCVANVSSERPGNCLLGPRGQLIISAYRRRPLAKHWTAMTLSRVAPFVASTVYFLLRVKTPARLERIGGAELRQRSYHKGIGGKPIRECRIIAEPSRNCP